MHAVSNVAYRKTIKIIQRMRVVSLPATIYWIYVKFKVISTLYHRYIKRAFKDYSYPHSHNIIFCVVVISFLDSI